MWTGKDEDKVSGDEYVQTMFGFSIPFLRECRSRVGIRGSKISLLRQTKTIYHGPSLLVTFPRLQESENPTQRPFFQRKPEATDVAGCSGLVVQVSSGYQRLSCALKLIVIQTYVTVGLVSFDVSLLDLLRSYVQKNHSLVCFFGFQPAD